MTETELIQRIFLQLLENNGRRGFFSSEADIARFIELAKIAAAKLPSRNE